MQIYLHFFSNLLAHTDGLVQERRNSIANALELSLSCTNPLIQSPAQQVETCALILAYPDCGHPVHSWCCGPCQSRPCHTNTSLWQRSTTAWECHTGLQTGTGNIVNSLVPCDGMLNGSTHFIAIMYVSHYPMG